MCVTLLFRAASVENFFNVLLEVSYNDFYGYIEKEGFELTNSKSLANYSQYPSIKPSFLTRSILVYYCTVLIKAI